MKEDILASEALNIAREIAKELNNMSPVQGGWNVLDRPDHDRGGKYIRIGPSQDFSFSLVFDGFNNQGKVTVTYNFAKPDCLPYNWRASHTHTRSFSYGRPSDQIARGIVKDLMPSYLALKEIELKHLKQYEAAQQKCARAVEAVRDVLKGCKLDHHSLSAVNKSHDPMHHRGTVYLSGTSTRLEIDVQGGYIKIEAAGITESDLANVLGYFRDAYLEVAKKKPEPLPKDFFKGKKPKR